MNRIAQFMAVSREQFEKDWINAFPGTEVPGEIRLPRRATSGSAGYDFFAPAGFELKPAAGFGKDGYKNFDGCMAQLQMQTYLVPKEFRKRKNKKGEEYGWSIAVMATPESIWGKKLVRKAYKEDPEKSRERIFQQVQKRYPFAAESDIRKILKP